MRMNFLASKFIFVKAAQPFTYMLIPIKLLKIMTLKIFTEINPVIKNNFLILVSIYLLLFCCFYCQITELKRYGWWY